MSTDKLWTAISGIERQLNNLKGELIDIDEEITQSDDAYQRGLNDAWEAARKISLMPPDEIEKVFPGAAKYNRYNLGYSGVEAIERLKAYEEKQKVADKIEVGDEVTAFNELTEEVEHFVVIEVGGYFGKGNVGLFALYGNNKSSVDFKAGCFSISAKFEIDKILEAMKE